MSHRHEEELTKQESAPDSPIPKYEQEQKEQIYSPAEGEGNGDNDDRDDGGTEEDDNIPSDTTERPHQETKDDTLASQQLLSESESQIQIPEVEGHIWEDNTPIQQRPQIPIPETEYRPRTQTTLEQKNRPSTPKAPRTTKKQLTPIEELAQHYELTKELKDNLAFYPLIVQKTLL